MQFHKIILLKLRFLRARVSIRRRCLYFKLALAEVSAPSHPSVVSPSGSYNSLPSSRGLARETKYSGSLLYYLLIVLHVCVISNCVCVPSSFPQKCLLVVRVCVWTKNKTCPYREDGWGIEIGARRRYGIRTIHYAPGSFNVFVDGCKPVSTWGRLRYCQALFNFENMWPCRILIGRPMASSVTEHFIRTTLKTHLHYHQHPQAYCTHQDAFISVLDSGFCGHISLNGNNKFLLCIRTSFHC